MIEYKGKEIKEVKANKLEYELNLDRKRRFRYKSLGEETIISNFKKFKYKFYPTELTVNEVRLLLKKRFKKGMRIGFWSIYFFFKSITDDGRWGILIKKRDIQYYTKTAMGNIYFAINHLLKLGILDIYQIRKVSTLGRRNARNIYYFNKDVVANLISIGNVSYLSMKNVGNIK